MYHTAKSVFFFFKFHQKVQHSIVQKFEFSAKKTKQNLASETLANCIFSGLRLWWWKVWLKWKTSRQSRHLSPPVSSGGLMNFVLILPLLFQHMIAVATSGYMGMLRSHKSDPQQQCRQSLLKFYPLSWKEKRLAFKPSFIFLGWTIQQWSFSTSEACVQANVCLVTLGREGRSSG